MNEPEWIDRDVVLAIHDEQLAEHGGLSGIRDQGLLDSALARISHKSGADDRFGSSATAIDSQTTNPDGPRHHGDGQSCGKSALARPRHLYSYSPGAGLYGMAASYAVGIARNHAFLDGNKRTAWVLCAVFLELNGIEVVADQVEIVRQMVGLAAGEITEEQFAGWLREPGTTRVSEVEK